MYSGLRAILGVLLIAAVVRGDDTTDQIAAMNAAMKSLRVISIDPAAFTAYFLPIRAEIVGDDDKGSTLTVTATGDRKSVSGILILRADPDETKIAVTLVKEKFGERYGLKPITVDTFECWVRANGKTVWHQPEGDGPIRRLVVDAQILPDAKELVLVTAAYTTERRKVQGVKMRVDWSGVEEALRKWVQADPVLCDARLKALVADLLKSDVVKIVTSQERTDEVTQQVRDMLTAEIQKRLLDQNEPRDDAAGKDKAEDVPEKKERGYYFSYRMKKEVDLRGGVETLDLNEVRDIRKRELVVAKLPL